MFGLGYVFAHQIQTNLDRVEALADGGRGGERSCVAALPLLQGAAAGRACRSAPRCWSRDDVPLPPDDLHAHPDEVRPSNPTAAPPPPQFASRSGCDATGGEGQPRSPLLQPSAGCAEAIGRGRGQPPRAHSLPNRAPRPGISEDAAFRDVRMQNPGLGQTAITP